MSSTLARPSRSSLFHGMLVIDKPAGWTSHDVVGRMRRLLGERHIGHAGTLDPAATGVLPLAIGEATKVVKYLSDASKTYLAEITLGITTDSHDLDGRVTSQSTIDHLTETDLASAFARQHGMIEQIPPMHSALKVGGRRLYELARRGETIERQPRQIIVHDLRLLSWHPPVATVWIDCSKGTYIRSMARDLGEALGVGAYLSNLVRLRTGPFWLDDAWTIDQLTAIDLEAEWESVAVHPDAVLEDHPALVLDEATSEHWRNGGVIPARSDESGPVRVYSPIGTWLGIGRYDSEKGAWRPVKTIRSEEAA